MVIWLRIFIIFLNYDDDEKNARCWLMVQNNFFIQFFVHGCFKISHTIFYLFFYFVVITGDFLLLKKIHPHNLQSISKVQQTSSTIIINKS